MIFGWLADLVLVLHLAFLLFVVFGGLLVLRRRQIAWVHAPVLVWGCLIEFAGIICPLTPLENWLRHRAGQAGYSGGFIDHYITAAMYPSGLTRGAQLVLGTMLVAFNAVVYWRVLSRGAARRSTR